ncbi:hypothetical protein AB4K20DRAFT_1985235 [Rhizopus microsporus]
MDPVAISCMVSAKECVEIEGEKEQSFMDVVYVICSNNDRLLHKLNQLFFNDITKQNVSRALEFNQSIKRKYVTIEDSDSFLEPIAGYSLKKTTSEDLSALLPKANVLHQIKPKREKKKVSNYAKRLLKVLIAAVTTFFKSTSDHQNKGPGTHKNHQIIKYQSSLQRPAVADIPLGCALAEICQLSTSLCTPLRQPDSRKHYQPICHSCDLRQLALCKNSNRMPITLLLAA